VRRVTSNGVSDDGGLRSPGLSELPPDPGLARLTGAIRSLQDSVVGTEAPRAVLAQVSAHLEQAAALLAPHAMRPDAPHGWEDLRRSAHTRVLSPQLADVRIDREQFSATVTFSTHYLGANGAVHGGVLPLLFDEVLGRLASTDRPRCRTAYLRVDFRRVTPIGRPLRVEARFDREEGRKRFLRGALYDGEEVTAEAEGLWVELREGAP
jgi:acyl-coenzyme A thioesterase PaaI-like protein